MEMRGPIDSLSCIAGVVYLTSPDPTSAQARLLATQCNMLAAYHGATRWLSAGFGAEIL